MIDISTIGCMYLCSLSTYRVFFFNSEIYDLALIQSLFWIFEIGRTLFHSIHRGIFQNAKTLLIEQILVWKNFPQSWSFIFCYLCFILWWILSNQINNKLGHVFSNFVLKKKSYFPWIIIICYNTIRNEYKIYTGCPQKKYL